MTPVRPCGKCGEEPRLPGQRWCRRCLTRYKVARYARLRAVEEPRWEPAIPAPVATGRAARIVLPLRLLSVDFAEPDARDVGLWRCHLRGRT